MPHRDLILGEQLLSSSSRSRRRRFCRIRFQSVVSECNCFVWVNIISSVFSSFQSVFFGCLFYFVGEEYEPRLVYWCIVHISDFLFSLCLLFDCRLRFIFSVFWLSDSCTDSSKSHEFEGRCVDVADCVVRPKQQRKKYVFFFAVGFR